MNIIFNIVNEKTTTSLMKTLTNMYEKPFALNKVFLMCKLFNLKMNEGANIIDHVNVVNTLLIVLSLVAIEFDDEIKAFIPYLLRCQ